MELASKKKGNYNVIIIKLANLTALTSFLLLIEAITQVQHTYFIDLTHLCFIL